MSATNCRPWAARHRFDAGSGWCGNGCGVRDDGRVIARSGTPIATARTEPAPPPPPEALDFTAPRRAVPEETPW